MDLYEQAFCDRESFTSFGSATSINEIIAILTSDRRLPSLADPSTKSDRREHRLPDSVPVRLHGWTQCINDDLAFTISWFSVSVCLPKDAYTWEVGLTCCEYQRQSVIDRFVPRTPEFLWPIVFTHFLCDGAAGIERRSHGSKTIHVRVETGHDDYEPIIAA